MIFIIYSITPCFELVIVLYTNVTAPLSKAILVSIYNDLTRRLHLDGLTVASMKAPYYVKIPDLGRFRIRSRNQRTNLNPNPDLIPDSESCVVESDLESESCRFESESDSDS